MIDGDSNPGAKKMSDAILTFVNGVGIANELLPREIQLLDAPFGTISEPDRIATSWLSEGMTVLAWSIGLAELPDFQTKCHPGPGSISLGMFRPGTRERLSQAALRDAAEIEMKSLTYLALNWRIGQFVLDPAATLDFAARLKDPHSPDLLVDEIELVDGDMAIDGLPLSKVPHERAGEVFYVVRERFNAFRWLQGFSPAYSTSTSIQ
jgi:hypothetical protein